MFLRWRGSLTQYEADTETAVERLYLGGDAYSAPAVYVKEAGLWKIYYICRDYLGSITHIANADGTLKAEYSYDAWGRLRNPDTQVAYAPGMEPVLFLGRGYTGHEHLTWFGLINMNARLYDPALGRFLSPDPYVQMPDFTQNFNRYSYCLNNPLRYVDENGEWIQLLIGGIIGGTVNLITNWKNIQGNFWKGLGYFGVGAGVGVLSAAGGAWLAGVTKAVGFGAGALVGAATGAVTGGASSLLINGGNNLLNDGKFFDNWKSNLASGALGGAISGGISGGIRGYKYAKELGANPWTGDKTLSSKSYSANTKTGIQPQADQSKHCYSVTDEYASSGRENFTRTDFQQAAANTNNNIVPDGADPFEVYTAKTGKTAIGIANWDVVGKSLSDGSAEVMGVISQDGVNHTVNVVGYTVENKLRLFGGGIKQILNSVKFWDPAYGTITNGHSSFLKVGYFKY